MGKPSSRNTAMRGITIKKKYGQHFLRSKQVVDTIIQAVSLTDTSSVFEIGCGEGILTRAIVNANVARVWVFEIDEEWVNYVRQTVVDKRLTIFHENFLDTDLSILEPHKPWVLLANLPYQITFPILQKLQQHRDLLKEGVIMVQEEVAQKILKTEGRGYGFISIFFQHFFELEQLDKIPPSAFYPPPKVFSRLLYFKPKQNIKPIHQEDQFWQFVKQCFKQPRRTLRNNLMQAHYDITKLSSTTLDLRAQQIAQEQLLEIWHLISPKTHS